ncbi:MAG TPA: gephyrin-like molybdotransferase Glp [Candidatus Polarisedimenticolia bacterium]|nr:gephyrin-like molybdotransferase Glp [Candidatus Polarisedimenticolia bacterium]
MAMMRLSEAEAAIQRLLTRSVEAETVLLAGAEGRFMAQDLVSPIDLPAHGNSAVDGFALRFADLPDAPPARLRLIGTAAAGRAWERAVEAGEAVRILTGARLPAGSDTVAMQEDGGLDGDTLHLMRLPRRGANIRERGEDIRAGALAIPAGRRLRAPEIALAAALGQGSLPVFRPLSVGLFSTGDEVRDPGTLLLPGQIWDANRWMLRHLLQRLGCRVSDHGILADEAPGVEQALQQAAHDHDLLITSGGISVGAEDHVGAVIRRRGSLDIWRLAIKPGKPVGFGDIDTCPILALPGNPIATMVLFLMLGRGIVRRLAGASTIEPPRIRLPAGFAFDKKPGRREFLTARIESDGQGVSKAVALEKQGSAILSTAPRLEGLIDLPEARERVSPGELVDFLALDSLLG